MKITMLRFLIFLVLIITALLSGCSDAIKQVETIADQIDPEIIEEAEDYLEEQDINAGELLIRAEIIARAKSWVFEKVPYGSFDNNPNNDYYDGYRADCSGFVSHAWKLKQGGAKFSATTVSLSQFANDITYGELMPGDAINNKRPSEIGHVVIFLLWLDKDHNRFVALEENGSHGRAVQTELTLGSHPDGGYTIKEYNNAAPGPYYAQRLNTLP